MPQSLEFFAATKRGDSGAPSVEQDEHKAASLSKNDLNGIYGMFGGEEVVGVIREQTRRHTGHLPWLPLEAGRWGG